MYNIPMVRNRYNPEKHGLADKPAQWKHSSIHYYIRDGYYGVDGIDLEIGFDKGRVEIPGAEYD
jgi:hypothetical protein